MINKDEERRKYVFINDGWDVIMEIDETEDNPEFSRMYLTDLKREEVYLTLIFGLKSNIDLRLY